MQRLNVSYLGAPHPVLNSYLLLCPMLGANIKFKCCCSKCPVSPLLYKTSQEMTLQTHTSLMACSNKEDVLRNACVIIAGPTHHKKDKIKEFKFDVEDIQRCSYCRWTFFHTFPRGPEIGDYLFSHANARTYNAFDNMQYIASALMAKVIKGHLF
ncbi:unnamed protein product [Parnassius apollo]|uniref:(apollo) hypothetical protein n=1 Tax=Parnassius apollo TaxID=110799 RepID=A0A8S3W040_PARAO|nr:unnamed protein product [Parnassius apollo]